MRQRSIPFRRHFAVFAFLLLTPLLGMGAYLVALYSGSEATNLKERMADVARKVAWQIDQDLESKRTALLSLATSRALPERNFQRFHEQARQVASYFGDAIIALRDLDGQQLIMTARPYGEPLSRTSDPVLRALDRTVIETRTFGVSDLYRGSLLQSPFVLAEIPIVEHGSVQFILNIAFPPRRLNELIGHHLVTPEWLISVVDKNGRVIARSADFEKFVGGPAPKEFIHQAITNESFYEGTAADGRHLVGYYTRSALSGWRVVAAVPREVIQRPLYASLAAFGGLALVGFCISAALAAFYAQYVSRPVGALEKLAWRMADHQEFSPIGTGISELDGVANNLARTSRALAEHERHQTLLINELNHRVRNTLAIVQAISFQSSQFTPKPDEFHDAFEGRLLALGSAHDALTKSAWKGAPFAAMVQEALRPFASKERLSLQGPDFELHTNGVVNAMILFHELATNATKYGALSNPEGRIELTWTVTSDKVFIVWKERGGPPVHPGTKQGFGSHVIKMTLKKPEVSFEPDGLRVTGSLNLSRRTAT